MRHTTVFTRTFTAGLVSALLLVSPVAARTGEPSSTSSTGSTGSTGAVAGTSSIRIDNFGRIDPNYYRGAQPEGRDYADLAALGVKTIINLTSDDAIANEQAMTEKAGMTYFQIPMTTHEAPTAAQLAEFLGIVNDPAKQPVYVHCVGGRHRTGVMTAAYRMTGAGWTADQAFKKMKQYKFGADFLHAEFKEFVYGYHAEPIRAAAAPATVAAAEPIAVSQR